MTDITNSSSAPKKRTAVALGLFDGVHLGHRAVIERAVAIAAEHKAVPAVFTFDSATVTTKSGLALLSTKAAKFAALDALGVRYVLSPDFSAVREMSGGEFVTKILRERLNAEYAVCGEDFRCGRNAACTAEMLASACERAGIRVCIVPPVECGGERISSSAIRQYLLSGAVEKANLMLGESFSITAPIVHGNRIGRTLDFPTINQRFEAGALVPRHGVYEASVTLPCGLHSRAYKAVANIGVKPTVTDEGIPVAETHIIGFSGNLYGSTLTVRLERFIRPEQKFADINALREQIRRDVRSVTDRRP